MGQIRSEKPTQMGRQLGPDIVPSLPKNHQNTESSYFDIPVRNLQIDQTLEFDLYNKHALGRYVQVHSAGENFTEASKASFKKAKIPTVFIPTSQRHRYNSYIETYLGHILDDPKIPEIKKSTILYKSATKLVQDMFEDPTSSENVLRTKKMVKNTVTHILRGRACLASIIRIMAYDYATYTHSMNVCVFGIALGKRFGFSTLELNSLGASLLLHDIGKSEINPAILKKQGPLTESEWNIIKTHPAKGMEILKSTGQFDRTVLTTVLQHHEKCSGRGYPGGLREPEIHLYAKIASLADVFDALTTVRPYKNAIESFPAFRIMQEEMRGSFNCQLLRELILLMTSKNSMAQEDSQDDFGGDQLNESAA
ncbi:MAG: HD domain-containing protein [Candidatus Eisenbacteria bacterium]|uniref:HD domain-containing protein n=1 Tax=Eiseniibacteriota bacterium TaxID=2212470 RepID=A0A948RXV2_UNCEI|nr:HD domain-containing protein [Candidatus Eisenbacteria bacterium]MBU1949640.1 HD domain-containing protein [Candidatus Eisenbacteria bacterium]MBU2693033.1 HD domain-containing protein [Candidatus Eisenbacteria bacterium]